MAETSHFLGHKSKGFRAKSLAFKPNIWDFRLSHHLKGGEIFVATHLFESTQADTMLGTE